jgi:bifunctional non-homologous end joining protein LigD
VGYYSKGKLIFAGKLGTGFPERVQRDLLARLAKLGPRPAPPFESVPREYLTRAVWVDPKLVVESEFTTWTADRLLRLPGRAPAEAKRKSHLEPLRTHYSRRPGG